MSVTIASFFAEALELSDDTRLELVERLIPTIKSDPSLEAEQINEVRRRMDEVRSGLVKTIPGEHVFQEIERSLYSGRA